MSFLPHEKQLLKKKKQSNSDLGQAASHQPVVNYFPVTAPPPPSILSPTLHKSANNIGIKKTIMNTVIVYGIYLLITTNSAIN